MFSAIDQRGNLVNLLDAIPDKQDFRCPACKSPLRLKNGQLMRPHFAHVELKKCRFYSENESQEHLTLKAELYHALSKTENVEIEKYISEIGQIADMSVNARLAVEVQCSRLSSERLQERTKSYHNNGIQVLWLLGKSLWLGKQISGLQKQFLYFSQNMGFHFWELDLENRCIRLKYLIYEDWHGKLHYTTKSVSFDSNLMLFFRLPFQKQPMSFYEVKQDQKLLIYIQRQLLARHSKWLFHQSQLYLQGRNVLMQPLEEFYPQVRPLTSENGFCQVEVNLSGFYNNFFHYYQNQVDKTVQILYPPAFYKKSCED